ncbi:MAG TPA: cell wall-binding repeat-containing protein, partial [Microbacterium sp.]|nr:cell wall-binding repeat-containing protein [Microbacterium sp.]
MIPTRNRLLAGLLVAVLWVVGVTALVATPAAAASAEVVRWSGPDRYATSAAISAKTFPGTVPVVFIASGQVFPDALSAAPAASRLGGPIL